MSSIIGTENPDTLKGSDQADIIIGLGGADTISGGDGDDTLDGGDYSNLRYIDAGNVIDGGAGDDVIYGGSGRDILRGGAGDDIIVGQGGSDSIDGGDGFDFAVYSRHDRGIFADLSTGSVTIFQAVSGSTVHRLTSIEGIIGTAFSDFLTGDAGVNALYGAGGNDFLIGGAGSDLLDGGAGFDVALYNDNVRLAEAVDTHRSIEQAQFFDGLLSFDREGAAAQVLRLFDSALDRRPSQVELQTAGGSQRSFGNMTGIEQQATALMASAEFQQKYGGLSNQAFVEQLYRFSFGREGLPSELAAWTGALNTGTSRTSVLVRFSESTEHHTLTDAVVDQGLWVPNLNAIAVARLYDAALNRPPDVGGLVANASNLASSQASLQSIANSFVASSEFQALYGALSNQAFIEKLYLNVLDRPGEAAGVQNWVNALNGGLSRSAVVLQFSESPEHVSLTAPRWEGGIQVLSVSAAGVETASQALHPATLEPADMTQDASLASAALFDEAWSEPGQAHSVTRDSSWAHPTMADWASEGLTPSVSDTPWFTASHDPWM